MLLALIEQAVAGAVRSDPRAERRLQALAGRTVEVDVEGTGVRLLVTVTLDGLRLGAADGTPADARVQAPPFTLLRALGEDTSAMLFRGELRTSGDTRLLQDLGDALAALRVDWEGLLAGRIGGSLGETLAGGLGTAFGRMGAWGRRTRQRAAEDLRDGLQEELRVLAPPAAVADLVGEVDDLREAVDRLSQRVARLERHRGSGGE